MGWRNWENFNPFARSQKDAEKPQKYHSESCVVDGHYFRSKREAARYVLNAERKNRGDITDLRLQTPFALNVGETTIGHYRADFTYIENGQFVVEDVKGYRNALYKWKKKHAEAQYGFTIREV